MKKSTPRLYARLNSEHKFAWAPINFHPNGKPKSVPGVASYFIRYTDNGKRTTESVGSDLAEAVIMLRRREAILHGSPELIEQFKANAPAQPASQSAMTLSQAMDLFLSEQITKAPGTVASYKNELQRLVACCGPDKPIVTIGRPCLLKFRDQLYQEKISDTTRHNRLLLAVILLKRFGIQKLLSKSDWPRPNQKVPDAYSKEEIEAMFKSAKPEDRLLIEMFLYSGARDGEVMHMVKSDVKITRHKKAGKIEEIATLDIQAKDAYDWKTKSKRDRRIRLPLEFAKRLLAARENKPADAILFPNTEGRPDSNLLKIVKKIAKVAKVSKVSLHKFRRTFATFKSQSGTDIQTLKAALGHQSITTTMRYLEAARAESESEGESTEAAFGDLVTVR